MIPFGEYCERVQHHIESAYGIPVITRDVPDPLTSDLNGAEIHIDFSLTPEQRLFLLAHLFGHTVQWNVRPDGYELGKPQQPPVAQDALAPLMDYEREAASYAVALFHDIGITEVDQWLADYSACDTAYLRHYYSTGEKQEFLTFWRESTPLLHGQPIPPFTPAKRLLRSDGIVI